MRLTREEIEAFKQQHLKELEADERRRAQERRELGTISREPEEDPEQAQKERELELAQLKEKIDEQFYKGRGYKRYVNHRGKVLWLTREEYAFRMERRKRHRGASGGDPQLRRRVQATVIILATLLIAVFAGYFLANR